MLVFISINMIVIRKARLNDINMLISLENELYDNQVEYLKKSKSQNLDDFFLKHNSNTFLKQFILQTIRSKNGLVLIAEFDKQIAGYLIIIIKKNIPIFKLEKLAEITDLYIKEEFRGNGISNKLRDEVFKWCNIKKISSITLDMIPNNIHAKRVYEKWGFTKFLIEMRMRIS
jgi:ribosomal protein S18 acetylase RimI-like enzyme